MTDISLSADSNLPDLIEGYRRFKASNTYNNQPVENQSPKAIAISCCDARVDPAMVTDCNPGELFVVRNVANIVPPYNIDPRHHSTSAALEFAVRGLEVKDIIVFGHSHCGGIRALMAAPEGKNASDFISAWMNIAKPAKQSVLAKYPDASPDEQARHCEKESLLISLNNLQSFPWIKERVINNQLFLHAWYFDLATGRIQHYDATSAAFIPLNSVKLPRKI